MRKGPVSLWLGFAGDAFGYAIDLGLPIPGTSQFQLDPVVKRECIWRGPVLRPSALLVDRQGTALRTRDEEGKWAPVAQPIAIFDSMMTEFADPKSTPEMIAVRKQIRSWRFYDHFRTDTEAPSRQPQMPVLSNDGADLAAALQTIREIGNPVALDAAIEDAFPGSQIAVANHDEHFEVTMRQHGLLRAQKARELSDGTLRYLLLIAAPRTPRLPALARLIAGASTRSQVIVVSHATRLVAALEREAASQSIVLEKQLGATRIVGADAFDLPAWKWSAR